MARQRVRIACSRRRRGWRDFIVTAQKGCISKELDVNNCIAKLLKLEQLISAVARSLWSFTSKIQLLGHLSASRKIWPVRGHGLFPRPSQTMPQQVSRQQLGPYSHYLPNCPSLLHKYRGFSCSQKGAAAVYGRKATILQHAGSRQPHFSTCS